MSSTAITELIEATLAEHVPHQTFPDSPPTPWCAACSPTVYWPCRFARLGARAQAENASDRA